MLAGSLRHRWGDGAVLAAGDVAVLRAGAGLEHDEVAGDDGARVLQCYLRSAEPGARRRRTRCTARRAAGSTSAGPTPGCGWRGCGRGRRSTSPAGLLVVRGRRRRRRRAAGRRPGATEPGAVLVWQLDTGRPAWALSSLNRPPAGPDAGESGAMPISASELLSAAYNDADRTIDLRRRLHRHPEIGLHLPQTQATVLEAFADLPIEVTTGTSTSSVVGVLRGARPGPTYLLRGDMDAPARARGHRPAVRLRGARRDARLRARHPRGDAARARRGCWPSGATCSPARSCSWCSRGRRASTARATCSRRGCSTSSPRRR